MAMTEFPDPKNFFEYMQKEDSGMLIWKLDCH